MTEAVAAEGRTGFRLTLVGTLVSSIGQGLTLPFLIVYLHDVLGASLPLAGLVIGLGAVIGLVGSGLGGIAGDRLGLGRSAAIGLVVQAAGTGLLATGAGVGIAAAAIALIAVGQSTVYPALNGLIAHQVPPEAQPRAFALRFGLLNAGIGIGALLSAWIVSVRNPASFHLIYGVDGATTVVFAVIVLIGLRRLPGYRATAGRDRVAGGGYREVLRDRAFVGFLLVALALGLFGYAQLNGPWAAFVTGQGGSTRVVGIAFAANTAAIVVVQLLVERLTRRFRRSRLLAATALVWASAWVLTGLAALPGLGALAAVGFVVSLAVFGIGETFYSPVGGALPNALAPDHLRGRYNALGTATWPIGNLLGPPIAGVLLAGAVPGWWVVFSTVGCVVTAGAAVLLGRRLPAAVERG